MKQFEPSRKAVNQAGAWADRDAVRLFTFASCTYPSANDRMVSMVSDEVTELVISFCVNARRTKEIPGLADFQITTTLWDHELAPSVAVERGFWKCVNLVLHSRELEPIFYRRDAARSRFFGENGSDLVLLHMRAVSDRVDERFFDLGGLAWDYMSKLRWSERTGEMTVEKLN